MKTVVITGATSGIGLAVLRECLKQGYQVIGIGRNAEKIESILHELEAYSLEGKLLILKANLMEAEEVNRVADEI